MQNQVDIKIIDAFVAPDYNISYDLDFTSFVNPESFLNSQLFENACKLQLPKILEKHLKQAIILAMHEFSYRLNVEKE